MSRRIPAVGEFRLAPGNLQKHMQRETENSLTGSGTGKQRPRGWLTKAGRKRVRRALSRQLVKLATLLVPRIYILYMRLVWATSRVVGRDSFELNKIANEHDGAVALLWHEEVFTVAYGYPAVGVHGHTLASLGDAGELITRILTLCGYVVFRGGSTTGRSRRRAGVLEDMIDHMRTHKRVIYGLTVDGSKGPVYRMKTGGIIIARECGKPIVLTRTWYKRYLRLPTWDRMAVPLPFNVIAYYLKGPYNVPESARSGEGLEQFRLRLESDLINLAAHSYHDLGRTAPENLLKRE